MTLISLSMFQFSHQAKTNMCALIEKIQFSIMAGYISKRENMCNISWIVISIHGWYLLKTAPSLHPRYTDLGTEPYQETLTLL